MNNAVQKGLSKKNAVQNRSDSKLANKVKLKVKSEEKETLEVRGQGEGQESQGALPRTWSTSVLRIKHRRHFWEDSVR